MGSALRRRRGQGEPLPGRRITTCAGFRRYLDGQETGAYAPDHPQNDVITAGLNDAAAKWRGALFGLTAAALFGLSAPVAKLLLGSISPVLLAGLLYLGAAAGLWLHRLVRRTSNEAGLVRSDIPRLAGVVAAGGILGPVLMLMGLSRVTALAGSLLLNLEAPFTVLLAVAVFRAHLGRNAAAAMVFILGGTLILKVQPGAFGADTAGVALLAGACLCWAVDNNLTQRLSLRDPFAIVRVKTLVAGVFNTGLGLVMSQGTSAEGRVPKAEYVVAALVLGSLSYGVSVVLDAYALRLVGAAREAAYFATAPFVGGLGALILLKDVLRWFDVAAMVSMGIGVALLLRERHGDHPHLPDVHHRHGHITSSAT